MLASNGELHFEIMLQRNLDEFNFVKSTLQRAFQIKNYRPVSWLQQRWSDTLDGNLRAFRLYPDQAYDRAKYRNRSREPTSILNRIKAKREVEEEDLITQQKTNFGKTDLETFDSGGADVRNHRTLP